MSSQVSTAKAMSEERSSVPTLNTPMWWIMFGLTTFLLSSVVENFKLFTLTPSVDFGFKLGISVIALLLVVVVMMYDSYVKEKLKGQVARPIQLFERLYAIQDKSTNGGSH